MKSLFQVRMLGAPDPALRVTIPLAGCVLVAAHTDADFAIACVVDAASAKLALNEAEGLMTFLLLEKSATNEEIKFLQELGAWSVTTRPTDLDSLRTLLYSWCNIVHRAQTMAKEIGRLRTLVDRDHLTGLLNMHSFYERLEAEMVRASRYQRALSVVMIDIDNFKLINDRNDHLFGSCVLKHVGQILRESIRQVDYCARFGGDEFVLALVETNSGGAQQLADRLRENLASVEFREGERTTRLTASFGIAENNIILAHMRPEDLVRHADTALYKAKEAGKNCTRVYLHESADERKLSEHDS